MRTRLTLLYALFLALPALLFAGGSGEVHPQTKPVDAGVPATVQVTAGEHFTHKLRIMPLIRVTNAPQMAAWCETTDGQFLATLFVTERLGTGGWRSAPADPTPTAEIRRPESLPVWAHRHGRVYADGLRVPTSEEPAADAVTAATPRQGFTLQTLLPTGYDELVVFFEVNHSADFNDSFGAELAPGHPRYSGGPWGSGQPALVYRALVSTADAPATTKLALVGHAAPDGSSGEIDPDLSEVTTAQHIVSKVRITVGDRTR
jgi:hypothetical protein